MLTPSLSDQSVGDKGRATQTAAALALKALLYAASPLNNPSVMQPNGQKQLTRPKP